MSLTYVHLSDIHFGQETGSEVYIHDDVKECLIEDLVTLKIANGIERMNGVILTGDVAFSGKKSEYDQAARWLDRLTQVIGCEKTDVLVVPGNHDIDRDQITRPAELMLGQLVEGGADELERFLADPNAREILYQKFHDYRAFSEGYGCPLASDGRVALTRQVGIAPGRVLRFVGLNSALLCTGRDGDEGNLLVGGRQHVLPRDEGCELVVLCHHPLESLQDRKLMARYVRSRARVHMFGHVHQPSAVVEAPMEEADLLTICAGAAVPPGTEDGYQFTYNVIGFEWEDSTEDLKVQIVPRTWSDAETRFDVDRGQFGADRIRHTLRCPNFKARAVAGPVREPSSDCSTRAASAAPAFPLNEGAGGDTMGRSTELLRLYFFRDLSPVQRVRALIDVDVLPDDWTIELTHILERRLFDKALRLGLEERLTSTVGALLTSAVTAERDDQQ